MRTAVRASRRMSSAASIFVSDCRSRFEVASSSTITLGWARNALASAMQLALAGGQGLPPLLNDRVQAAGQVLDELDEPDGPDRLVHVGGAGVRPRKTDVLPNRPSEQERLLRHHSELAPQRRQGHRAKVVAVDEDSPCRRVIETGDQLGHRRLPRSRGTDERHRLARRDAQVHAVSTGTEGS